jgi:hypothetical protein
MLVVPLPELLQFFFIPEQRLEPHKFVGPRPVQEWQPVHQGLQADGQFASGGQGGPDSHIELGLLGEEDIPLAELQGLCKPLSQP